MNYMILISFIVFSGLVGLITYFKTKDDTLSTSEGYFLGGRSLTGGVIAGSLLLTNLSAVSFVGMAGQAYSQNMAVMGWEVGSGITLILIALFLVPRYLKQGITTIPDFIQSRFDDGTRAFITILFVVSYVVNLLPITLYSGAVAMGQIFNISEVFGITYAQSIWIMVWVIGIIGSIYAIFGGLKAVAISDTINGIALVIGGLLVPVFGLLYLGEGSLGEGFNLFLTSTPAKLDSVGAPDSYLPFSTLFTGLVLVNLYYWGTDQSIIQRALGAKNLKEGQKGVIFAGLLKVLTPIIVIIPGILAYQILGPDVKMDTVYPKIVSTVLPGPLVGLFAAAMMGAILSTFNSVLNSASTLFALNIYKPSIKGHVEEKQLIKVGKIFGIIVALISMIGAPFIMNAPKGLFDYLQIINGFFNVPIFTIIFMGYMTKRVPPIAAKVAITFFVVVYAMTQLGVWNTGLHFLHISAILFVISCGIMYVIGKIKPMDKDYVLPNNNVVDIEPWEHRYDFSLFVVFIMLAMYIVFSKLGLAREQGLGMDTAIYIGVLGAICFVASMIIKKNQCGEKKIINEKA